MRQDCVQKLCSKLCGRTAVATVNFTDQNKKWLFILTRKWSDENCLRLTSFLGADLRNKQAESNYLY